MLLGNTAIVNDQERYIVDKEEMWSLVQGMDQDACCFLQS